MYLLQNNSGITKEREIATRGLRTIFQEVFAVNIFGAAVTADAFLPLLKKSKAGPRILNVSSGLGSIGTMILPDGIYRQSQLLVSNSPRVYLKESSSSNDPYDISKVYNSSKTALNSITCTLAMRNPDLHVVSLDPGWIGTNLNNYAGPGDPKDGVKVVVQHVLKRTGKSPGFYGNEGEMPW
jgi:NAD(P)-dependent dehydrogenase (short-subunit alcohol dehydrogenase family)